MARRHLVIPQALVLGVALLLSSAAQPTEEEPAPSPPAAPDPAPGGVPSAAFRFFAEERLAQSRSHALPGDEELFDELIPGTLVSEKELNGELVPRALTSEELKPLEDAALQQSRDVGQPRGTVPVSITNNPAFLPTVVESVSGITPRTPVLIPRTPPGR